VSQVLKVVFLAASDNASTRSSIEAVCRLPDVEPLAILHDQGVTKSSRRLKNFRNNIRRDGIGYPLFRLVASARRFTDGLVARSVGQRQEVPKVLRKAFPDRSFSFGDLARNCSLKVVSVPDLNGEEAVAKLRDLNADLGVVVGTRVLRRNIFSVPRLGCINLHKGRVPDYRGMPPGFWELFDGAASAGITVHFVDSGLDTGDVIATADVPIEPLDTPDTLLEKLHIEGTRTLAAAVSSIQRGSFSRQPQQRSSGKTRSKPSRAQLAQLRKRLPHWQPRGDLAAVLKNLYSLAVYWSGIYAGFRALHRARGNRAAILLHHRVNDWAGDVLTTDLATLAAQLMALTARYPVTDSETLVRAIAEKRPFPATSIAIHFDDCYRDVYTNGAAILKALNVPATFFVNPGFLDTERTFAHDRRRFPFRFENLSSAELRAWTAEGFTVGAHTVNHIDLGTCTVDEARFEIVESGRKLSEILGSPVTLFSFPFGSVRNIRPETAEIVMQSDYAALFSAHGGFASLSSSLSDIPRIGCSGQTTPLALLLEVEGLAPAQLKQSIFRR
jgi:hypothetical protein